MVRKVTDGFKIDCPPVVQQNLNTCSAGFCIEQCQFIRDFTIQFLNGSDVYIQIQIDAF